MMDLEVYRMVLEWKLQRKLSLVKQYGYDEAETALRQDMAALKVVWYNNFLQDWWSFLRNTHPVLATCLSHRLHVVSKTKRAFVYYMLTCVHVTFSVMNAEAETCSEPGNFECDPTGLTVERWCCTVETLGLIALYETFQQIGLSAIIALSTIVFGQVWFLIAACGCCQHRPPVERARWEKVALGTLVVFGSICTVFLAFGIVYMVSFPQIRLPMVRSFGMMKSFSFIGSFLFQSLIFFRLWHAQARDPFKYVDKYHLLYTDYLDFRMATARPELRFRPANSVFFPSVPQPAHAAAWPITPGRSSSRSARWLAQRTPGGAARPQPVPRGGAAYAAEAKRNADEMSTDSSSLPSPSAAARPHDGAPASAPLGRGSRRSRAEPDTPYVPPPRRPAPTHGQVVAHAREAAEHRAHAEFRRRSLEDELRHAEEQLLRISSTRAADPSLATPSARRAEAGAAGFDALVCGADGGCGGGGRSRTGGAGGGRGAGAAPGARTHVREGAARMLPRLKRRAEERHRRALGAAGGASHDPEAGGYGGGGGAGGGGADPGAEAAAEAAAPRDRPPPQPPHAASGSAEEMRWLRDFEVEGDGDGHALHA